MSDDAGTIGAPSSDEIQLLDEDAAHCALILHEFRQLEPARRVRISRCPAGQYTARFLFEHVGLADPVPVRMHSLVVLQKNRYYTLRLYDAPENSPHNAVDYTAFLQSVRIV